MTAFELDRSSSAYARMTAAGFRFSDIVTEQGYRHQVMFCRFECVCGRKEIFGPIAMTEERASLLPSKLDIAQMLEDGGAVSEEHLAADGYTPEQIAEIRKPYAVVADAA